MKKNIIRLTESELKNYIRKVVSEQTAPAPQAVDLTKLKNRIIGKNVLLFTDVAEPNGRGTLVRIESIESNPKGGVVIGVKDLKFFDAYNNRKGSDTIGQEIKNLRFFCNNPTALSGSTVRISVQGPVAGSENDRALMYSKLLQGILVQELNCAPAQNVTTQDLGQETLK
jgi:hypothetical protein